MLVRFENCKSCASVLTEVDLIGHTVLLPFPLAGSGLYLSSYNAEFALGSGENTKNFLGVFSVKARKGHGTLRQGQSRTVVASGWISSGCCRSTA